MASTVKSCPVQATSPSAEPIPDTSIPAQATPGVQTIVDKVKEEVQRKTNRTFNEFKATLYLKQYKEYAVKVQMILIMSYIAIIDTVIFLFLCCKNHAGFRWRRQICSSADEM